MSSLVLLTVGATAVARPAPEDQTVPVFDEAVVEWDRATPDELVRDGLRIYKGGQLLERTIELPELPSNQRDARRIIATLILEPVIVEEDGKLKPGDPWTRLGSVSVVQDAGASASGRDPAKSPAESHPNEVEILRFITGFGGHGTFTQDVTALAPLLHGKTTFHLFISTYKKPAWKVTLTLKYTTEGAGYRRPAWAQPIFSEGSVTAEHSTIQKTIEVPTGLARPRVHITSTGHATDGTGGDEFISRTHVLRIDGIEVARWRPWSEGGGAMRTANPMSGRVMLDGRELWSSDIDRSGWTPGAIVEPLELPVAELTPGRHVVELEIINIRPKDQLNAFGYWRVCCIAVADEPWPNEPAPPN